MPRSIVLFVHIISLPEVLDHVALWKVGDIASLHCAEVNRAVSLGSRHGPRRAGVHLVYLLLPEHALLMRVDQIADDGFAKDPRIAKSLLKLGQGAMVLGLVKINYDHTQVAQKLGLEGKELPGVNILSVEDAQKFPTVSGVDNAAVKLKLVKDGTSKVFIVEE